LASHFEGTPLQAQADAVMSVLDVPIVGHSAAADRELQRRISSFLLNRRFPTTSKLKIDAHNGVVTLQGTHRSFYHKQLCINCCQRVAGVVRLIDSTRVVPER
jgi:osmotically-inducible protein OsmY